MTKNDKETCYRLGDKNNSEVRQSKIFVEALRNKKMFISVHLTSIGLDKNTNLFLSQNLSDYNNKLNFIAESSDEKG